MSEENARVKANIKLFH